MFVQGKKNKEVDWLAGDNTSNGGALAKRIATWQR
jgi:hypothetical protein